MEASNSHGVKNITLILFYFQEHPFLFAFTYDMVHDSKSGNSDKSAPAKLLASSDEEMSF